MVHLARLLWGAVKLSGAMALSHGSNVHRAAGFVEGFPYRLALLLY
jgi:hypothetical protein